MWKNPAYNALKIAGVASTLAHSTPNYGLNQFVSAAVAVQQLHQHAGTHAFWEKNTECRDEDENAWMRKIIERLPLSLKDDPKVLQYYEQLKPWKPSEPLIGCSSPDYNGCDNRYNNYCHWYKECSKKVASDKDKNNQKRQYGSNSKPPDKAAKTGQTPKTPIAKKDVKATDTDAPPKEKAKSADNKNFFTSCCQLVKKFMPPSNSNKVAVPKAAAASTKVAPSKTKAATKGAEAPAKNKTKSVAKKSEKQVTHSKDPPKRSKSSKSSKSAGILLAKKKSKDGDKHEGWEVSQKMCDGKRKGKPLKAGNPNPCNYPAGKKPKAKQKKPKTSQRDCTQPADGRTCKTSKPAAKEKKSHGDDDCNHLDTGLLACVTAPRKMSRTCCTAKKSESESDRNECGLAKLKKPCKKDSDDDSGCNKVFETTCCMNKDDEKTKCSSGLGSKGDKSCPGARKGGAMLFCAPSTRTRNFGDHCGSNRNGQDEKDKCCDCDGEESKDEDGKKKFDCCKDNEKDGDTEGICGKQQSGDWCDKFKSSTDIDNDCKTWDHIGNEHIDDDADSGDWLNDIVLTMPPDEQEEVTVEVKKPKTDRELLEEIAECNVLDGLRILSKDKRMASKLKHYNGDCYPMHKMYFMFKPYSYYDMILHLNDKRAVHVLKEEEEEEAKREKQEKEEHERKGKKVEVRR